MGVQIRQVLERRQDAQELVQLRTVGAKDGGQWSHRALEHRRRQFGVYRQLVVGVLEYECAIDEFERELAALQHTAVLIAKDWQQ